MILTGVYVCGGNGLRKRGWEADNAVQLRKLEDEPPQRHNTANTYKFHVFPLFHKRNPTRIFTCARGLCVLMEILAQCMDIFAKKVK